MIADRPTGDIDFRVRCVVRGLLFDRVCYGITAEEYYRGTSDARAENVTDSFDHSAGRGRRARGPGMHDEAQRTQHFFTPGLGRHDEIRQRRASEGSIRR